MFARLVVTIVIVAIPVLVAWAATSSITAVPLPFLRDSFSLYQPSGGFDGPTSAGPDSSWAPSSLRLLTGKSLIDAGKWAISNQGGNEDKLTYSYTTPQDFSSLQTIALDCHGTGGVDIGNLTVNVQLSNGATHEGHPTTLTGNTFSVSLSLFQSLDLTQVTLLFFDVFDSVPGDSGISYTANFTNLRST